MIINNAQEEYSIKKCKKEINRDSLSLSWTYKAADGFLIVVTNIKRRFSLEDAVAVLMETFETDANILRHQITMLYNDNESEIKIFYISENNFNGNRNTFNLNLNIFRKESVYKISIYACKNDERGITVYESMNQAESTQYKPVKVICEYKYFLKGLIQKQHYCELEIKGLDNSTDEVIFYRINGIDIPISPSMYNRKIYFLQPQNEDVYFGISEEYEKMYVIEKRRIKENA